MTQILGQPCGFQVIGGPPDDAHGGPVAAAPVEEGPGASRAMQLFKTSTLWVGGIPEVIARGLSSFWTFSV